MNKQENDKLPLGVKIGYGGGEGANSLIFTFLYAFGMFFFTDVVKLDPAFAGLVLMIGTLWDAVTDPAIGIYSDRLQTRWGRRRPFLLLVAVPYGVISWLLFTDFSLDPFLTKIYFIIMIILYFTAFTCLTVPHLSLSAEMTRDYDERTSLVGWRAGWSQATSIIGAGLPLSLAAYFGDMFGSQKMGWSATSAIFGLLCIPMVLLSWRVTRGYELYSQDVDIRFKDLFDAPLKNRPFMYTIGLYAFGLMGMTIAGSVGVYFMTYYMGFSEDQSSIAFGILFGCTVLWIPLINLVSSKLGKRQAFMIFIGLWACVQSIGIFLVRPGWTMGYYLMMFLAAGGLVGIYMIGWAMIPDCIEVDEFKTGDRREGLYYGIIAFVQKGGCTLSLGISGIILSKVGYVPDAPQTETALLGIRMIFGPGVAFLLIISIIFCYFMPITRKKHQALCQAIVLKKQGRAYETKSLEGII